MKRLTILAILCLLCASSARADDGWWDFLWRMDPKFMGPNIELHLCWDEDRVYKNCEGLFGIPALFGKDWLMPRSGRFIHLTFLERKGLTAFSVSSVQQSPTMRSSKSLKF